MADFGGNIRPFQRLLLLDAKDLLPECGFLIVHELFLFCGITADNSDHGSHRLPMGRQIFGVIVKSR
jgi:hypothetical protein